MTNNDDARQSEHETRSTDDSRSIFRNMPVQVSNAGFAEKIKSPELATLARSLVQNGDNIGLLLAMPMILMQAGLVHSFTNLDFIRAVTRTNTVSSDLTKYGEDPALTKKIDDEMSRLWNEESETKFRMTTGQLLMAVLYTPSLSGYVRVLLFSCMATAWTTFESLASDLWVQLVNSRTTTLGRQVASYIAKANRESGSYRSDPACWGDFGCKV